MADRNSEIVSVDVENNGDGNRDDNAEMREALLESSASSPPTQCNTQASPTRSRNESGNSQSSSIASDGKGSLSDSSKKPTNTAKKTLSQSLQGQPTKHQRSPVKPFFCCGSELSLVSLVDGLELKEGVSSGKGSSIECNESSDGEDPSQSSNGASSIPSSHRSGLLHDAESPHNVIRCKSKKKDKHSPKKKFWSLRFRGRWSPRGRMSQSRSVNHRCDMSHHTGCAGAYHSTGSPGSGRRSPRVRTHSTGVPLIDLSQINDFDRLYPVEGIDEIRLRERAEEMATGITMNTRALRPNLGMTGSMLDILRQRSRLNSADSADSPDSPIEDYSLLVNSLMWRWQGEAARPPVVPSITMPGIASPSPGSSSDAPCVHTQVDYIHCLVPHLVEIMSCPFYWGIMDRFEAERLLDNKPEGTFLLRDSAQEDFLFSVSFRRYNRCLHARVEQWNHRFSFDALDPAVFSASSVCELMDHYKDASCCMFFEPMLTRPLARNITFSLQHICRAVICDKITYDKIRILPLPNSLKQFLQAYHYKQKVRVRHFDDPNVAFTSDLLRLLNTKVG